MDGTTQLLESDRRYLVHPLHHPDDHRQPLVVVEGQGRDVARRRRPRIHRRPGRVCGTSMSAMAAANWPMRRPRRCARSPLPRPISAPPTSRRCASPRRSSATPTRIPPAVYFTTAGAEFERVLVQIRALLLEGQRQAGKDQDHLAHPRLSRRDDGGDERHRHGRLSQDVRAAGAGLHPGRAALRLSLAGQRGAGHRRRRCGREGDPRRRPRDRRGGHLPSRSWARAGSSSRRQPISPAARDLRPLRRPADRRRGDHRLRPHRQMVRARPLGRRAGPRLVRQGGDERLSAVGRRHRCRNMCTRRSRARRSTANSCMRRPIRGHPVCCAVGLRNVEIIESEGLVERAAVMGRRLLDRLEGTARSAGCRRCARARHDVRRRAGDRPQHQGAGARARRQGHRARRWRAGCCRASAPGSADPPIGDTICLSPPLSTPAEMLDRIPQILRESIVAATK